VIHPCSHPTILIPSPIPIGSNTPSSCYSGTLEQYESQSQTLRRPKFHHPPIGTLLPTRQTAPHRGRLPLGSNLPKFHRTYTRAHGPSWDHFLGFQRPQWPRYGHWKREMWMYPKNHPSPHRPSPSPIGSIPPVLYRTCRFARVRQHCHCHH